MADANTAAENTAVSTQLGDIDLKELLEAGVHFGHQTQRWNPRMRDYIYAERDGVHIFDLVKQPSNCKKPWISPAV